MDKIKFKISSNIECYALEEINLDEGKLKIGYIEFENNLVLLDHNYYMDKENFINNEGKSCLVGDFDNSILEYDYEPNDFSKDFTIRTSGKVEFQPDTKNNTPEELKKFIKLNTKKAETLFLSFVNNNGTQDDLSTSEVNYIDIS